MGVGVGSRVSDFNVKHATARANFLFGGSLKPLHPYVVMLF